MTRFAVPAEAFRMAHEIAAAATLVERCQTGFTTLEALEQGLAAIQRIRSQAAEMALHMRRQRAAALNLERDVDRRNRSLGEPVRAAS